MSCSPAINATCVPSRRRCHHGGAHRGMKGHAGRNMCAAADLPDRRRKDCEDRQRSLMVMSELWSPCAGSRTRRNLSAPPIMYQNLLPRTSSLCCAGVLDLYHADARHHRC